MSHVDSLIQNLWSHVPVAQTYLEFCRELKGILVKRNQVFERKDGQLLHMWIVCLHGPLRANPLIGCDVNSVGGGVMTDSQAQVSDGTGTVLLHEDVLGLQVSVSDAWLSYTNRHLNTKLDFNVTSELSKKCQFLTIKCLFGVRC